MDATRTKLAIRTMLVGYRSANGTATLIGGTYGREIAADAKKRAGEILDRIDEDGTDAADERRTARREVDS